MFEFLSSRFLSGAAAEVPPTAEAAASGLDDFDGVPFEIVRNSRQLVHILRQAIEARLPVTLSSPHLGGGMPTRLLCVDTTGSILYIRRLFNDALHATLVRDRRFNLLVRQEESMVLLSLTLDRVDLWNRQDCYLAALPSWALSSQMRAWRRVHLPAAASLSLHQHFPDKDSLDARVVDISEGGLGLAVPHLPLRGIRPRERWTQARLALGKSEIGPLALEVRHVRSGDGHQRIGLAIHQATEGQCQHLRRLLLRLQSDPPRRTAPNGGFSAPR